MVVDALKDGQDRHVAVLCSGGLDSTVLVAYEALTMAVHPLYVNGGLAWERVERDCLDRVLSSTPFERVESLVELESSVADVYPRSHWARRGSPPAYASPDDHVYLAGRNVLLLSKAAVYCAMNGIGRLAIGSLAGNPFPDATPGFYDLMARALSEGLDRVLRIAAPFSTFSKTDVIKLGDRLDVPLEHTLSCMRPATGVHCGRCSKCRERLQAFDAAGLVDPAVYAFLPRDISTGT